MKLREVIGRSLWRLIQRSVEDYLEDMVSHQLAYEIRQKTAEIEKLEERFHDLVDNYGKVFKGFQSPIHYMNFIVKECPYLEQFLKEEFQRRHQYPENLIVTYVTAIRRKAFKREYRKIYSTRVPQRESWILGALVFPKPVKGQLEFWIDGVRKWINYLHDEKWTPLISSKAMYAPDDTCIEIKAPRKPSLLYVIKA
ncbi:MAG: hypothetical protein J7K62_02375, partial [Thermoplasmata archaeon]|nr:hypothetical protein [Thermoplasmata archaeon]